MTINWNNIALTKLILFFVLGYSPCMLKIIYINCLKLVKLVLITYLWKFWSPLRFLYGHESISYYIHILLYRNSVEI